MDHFWTKWLTVVVISVVGFTLPLRAESSFVVTVAALRESTMQTKVQQLGLGATVKLTSAHGKRYRGYITDITDGSFEVTETKTLRTHSFEFSSVDRIAGRPLPDPADPIGNRILRAIFRTTSRFAFGP